MQKLSTISFKYRQRFVDIVENDSFTTLIMESKPRFSDKLSLQLKKKPWPVRYDILCDIKATIKPCKLNWPVIEQNCRYDQPFD